MIICDTEVPVDWKTETLGHHVTLKSGRHLPASQYNSSGVGEPYLTGPSDFKNGNVVVTKWTEQHGIWAAMGEILVTVKGSGSGSCFLMPLAKAVISRQLMAVSPSGSRVDQRYLYYVFKAREGHLAGNATGNLIPGLSRPDILNLKLPIPPPAEQRAIANALSDMDALIAAQEKLIAKLRDIKQGMMQELLTGRTRLL